MFCIREIKEGGTDDARDTRLITALIANGFREGNCGKAIDDGEGNKKDLVCGTRLTSALISVISPGIQAKDRQGLWLKRAYCCRCCWAPEVLVSGGREVLARWKINLKKKKNNNNDRE